MKLIVGLGNPGSAYKDTRHNIGFTVVKAFAQDYGVSLKRDLRANALCAKTKISEQEVLFCLPQTYMNLSGSAVRELARRHKVGLTDIIVVCDDLDLDFGRIKIKIGGSSAGHRGIQSIIDALASRDFTRLRIGIGRPGSEREEIISDYVLSGFNKNESGKLTEIVENSVESLGFWLEYDIDKTMNKFNKKCLVKDNSDIRA